MIAPIYQCTLACFQILFRHKDPGIFTVISSVSGVLQYKVQSTREYAYESIICMLCVCLVVYINYTL